MLLKVSILFGYSDNSTRYICDTACFMSENLDPVQSVSSRGHPTGQRREHSGRAGDPGAHAAVEEEEPREVPDQRPADEVDGGARQPDRHRAAAG